MNKQYAINYLRCSGFSKEQIREIADALKEWPQLGHWVSMGEGFSSSECSVCGCVEFVRSDFCPNCGAKMQEGGNE